MNQKDPGDVMCRWQMCDSECVRAAGGVTQKAPDFRECSPSVEPSAPADSKEAQSVEDMETRGVGIQCLMMELLSRN